MGKSLLLCVFFAGWCVFLQNLGLPSVVASDLQAEESVQVMSSEPTIVGLEAAFEMAAVESLDLNFEPVERPTLESLATENRELRRQLVEIERRLSALESARGGCHCASMEKKATGVDE